MEADILKLLSNKENYNKYNKYIVVDRLSSEVQSLFRELPNYYDEIKDDREIDWNEFKTWYLEFKHPTLSAPKAELIEAWCEKLASYTAPVRDVVLKNFFVRDYATQLADAALDVVDGKTTDLDEVTSIFHEYRREIDKLDASTTGSRFSVDDWEEQIGSLKGGVLYEWGLNEVDLIVGPIRKGDFIILGARPDGGKTTFLATQVAHFAKQLEEGQCILWCNNEESASKVKTRQAQAILRWTNDEVTDNPARTRDEVEKALGGKGKIVLFDETSMSVDDIDEAIERYNPSIIVIDQVWKVTGFERQASSDIHRYALLAKHIRDVAKRVGPVIGVSQLGDGAQGLKYPDMSTLYNSKTAVQGEADCIILIGYDPDEPSNIRHIHAPKNKMAFADPKYRKSGLAVEIDGERAQFISKIPRRVRT